MSSERLWAITEILDRRVADDQVHFLVRWEPEANLANSWVTESAIRSHNFGSFIDAFMARQQTPIDSAQTLLQSISSDDESDAENTPLPPSLHHRPAELSPPAREHESEPPMTSQELTVKSLFSTSRSESAFAMINQLPTSERRAFIDYATRHFSRVDLITLQRTMFGEAVSFFDEMESWIVDALLTRDIAFVQDVLILIDLLPIVSRGVNYTIAATAILRATVLAQNKDVNIITRRIIDNWKEIRPSAPASSVADGNQMGAPEMGPPTRNDIRQSESPTPSIDFRHPDRVDRDRIEPTVGNRTGQSNFNRKRGGPQSGPRRGPVFNINENRDDRRRAGDKRSSNDLNRAWSDGPRQKSSRLTDDDRRSLLDRGACLYFRKPGHTIAECRIRPANRKLPNDPTS